MTRISRSQLPDAPGGLRHGHDQEAGDWCGGTLPEPGFCRDVRPPEDSCSTLPPPSLDWRRALVGALLRRAAR